jgi:hypothetical protein
MTNLCILGFGISTLCFTLYLIDNNLVNNFDKIIILEKNKHICHQSLRYKNVNSNSTLKSMLSIFKNKIFIEELNKLEEKYNFDSYINLYEFNEILFDLCNIYLEYLKQFDNINIKFNFCVDNIQIYDNNFIINNTIHTNKIILAMGGDQNLEFYNFLDKNKILKNIDTNKIILSKKLFTSSNINYLHNKKLLIIGSSHSILSIIDLIFKHQIQYKSITIYSRNQIKVFYKSKEECFSNNDTCCNDDICTDTFYVNRYDGLRENSKKIYLELHKYKNINIINNYTGNYKEYDYIIPCWGYFKNIPLINGLDLKYDIKSDKNFNLISNSKIYKNIFLLGLSSKPNITVTQKNFSKSIDGIWIYYNIISPELYKNLL